MNDYNDDPGVSYTTGAPHTGNLEVTFYASILISIMLKGGHVMVTMVFSLIYACAVILDGAFKKDNLALQLQQHPLSKAIRLS